MARLTFTRAQTELRALGVTLNRTAVPGEFRVALDGVPRSRGGASYYTEDLADALATGKAMAKERAAELRLFDARLAQARREGWDTVTA